jgi:hypothetical protein
MRGNAKISTRCHIAAAFFLLLTAVTFRAGYCPYTVFPEPAARFFRYYAALDEGNDQEKVGWVERVAYSLILSNPDTRSST